MAQPKTQASAIVFRPWVGPNYRSSHPRLLVVGESHYDWKSRTDPLRSITISVVEYWMKHPKPFFTNIVATCTGGLPDAVAREDFWNSVAFYNFIQEFAGEGPRIRPRYALWPKSKIAFREALFMLKPELVLILGNQNWDNMDGLDGRKGEPLQSVAGRYSETWMYPTGDGDFALALHVKHPAAAFNFRTFSPLFIEAKHRMSAA